MFATTTRTRVWAGLLGLAMLTTTVFADEDTDTEIEAETRRSELPRSDAVYLFDVSGSMRKRDALNRAKTLLTQLLDKVVQPGTQTAVIPFGAIASIRQLRRIEATLAPAAV